LLKIKKLATKNVIQFGYPAELGVTLKQSKELSLNIQWYAVYTAEDPQVISLANEAAEGLLYSHFFNPDPKNQIYAEYMEKYLNKYSEEPAPHAGLAYDFAKILFEKIKQCGGTEDTTCLKTNLYATQNYNGVTGKISFDQNGDTRKEIILKTVKDGKFVPYEN